MFRNNRLVDSSPRRDVNRCDVVSGPRKATLHTSKLISRWPVGFRDMSTRMTRSGCVTRIDEDHRHTDDLGFVLDERSELIESPRVQVATLSLANRYPVSNARNIFKCNRSFGVFGFRNQLLGGAMIHVFGKSGHPTRTILQMAFCGLSAFALKSGFQRIKSVSGLVDLVSRMDLSIGINGKVLDAKIGTENPFWVKGRFFRRVNHNAKVECAFDEDQVCLTLAPVHPSLLIISNSDRDFLMAFQGQNGDCFETFPRQNPLVVDHSTIKPKLWV